MMRLSVRGRAARCAAVVAGFFLLVNSGWGYYYYTYFNSSSAPYTPIPCRFDLTALVNNTVPFFISGTGPSAFYPGDSFPAVISQITAAANIWNNVSTSSIRLAYGGLYNPGTTQSAPGIQIEFSDDIPPGLLAVSAPETFGNLATDSNGTFIPITLSLMVLPTNLPNVFDGPSYSEEFFVTLVHEFGHTMGLQHTLASSVMSTYNTTSSTKASPLGADDIAGISLLYPAPNYLASVGSISGTVTLNGAGVNLASVVAISPSNPAIATLTNPDGTYQINGVPPGLYYVYVHPLPAPVEGEGSPDNIFYPHNSSGVFLAPNTGFITQFYPNTQSPSPEDLIAVNKGAVTQGINFNVTPTSSPGISSVRTYAYNANAQTYVVGAPVMASATTTVAATGEGLLQPYTSSSTSYSVTPGLNVGLLGTAAEIGNLRTYSPPNPYIAVDVTVANFSGPGPKHLLFSTPGNLYVLPAGFSVVDMPPPVISALAPATDANGNPAVAIAGLQFQPNTQIFFDGLPAVIEQQSSNLLIVTPPPAPAGYTAAVVALNPDGQSSLFLKPGAPSYTYGATAAPFALTAGPSLVVSPSVIPAGGSFTVNVQGTNTNFIPGVTTVGFGTSDIVVNQVTVVSPTQLQVTVTPTVTAPSSNITVTTGLEVISQALGSQIAATDNPQQ
ncbi:MAG TPA: IPT/TIG domain-containing protein [Bryobacteraceae bacterium]|nr:IPT/TIG domain-containing protein [Bryobacteraceae bacterium]